MGILGHLYTWLALEKTPAGQRLALYRGDVRVIQADHLHEAQLLSLDISKAQEKLGWRPSYTARQAVEETVRWYKRFYEGKDVSAFTAEQIEQFEGNLVWKKN